MSGFEVAGLVLGAFPIFLECLEAYLEISDMKDFKPVLKRLNRQLKTEKCKLTNTCRNLVNGIVSTDQAHKLASGTGWDDRDFQDKLQQRLGLETATVFVEVVGHLFESLTKLSDEVGLNREQKVFPTLGMCLGEMLIHFVTAYAGESQICPPTKKLPYHARRNQKHQHRPISVVQNRFDYRSSTASKLPCSRKLQPHKGACTKFIQCLTRAVSTVEMSLSGAA